MSFDIFPCYCGCDMQARVPHGTPYPLRGGAALVYIKGHGPTSRPGYPAWHPIEIILEVSPAKPQNIGEASGEPPESVRGDYEEVPWTDADEMAFDLEEPTPAMPFVPFPGHRWRP